MLGLSDWKQKQEQLERKDSNGERRRWVGQMETVNQEEMPEIKSTNR